MLNIIINFDISARLTLQSSTIMCHDKKHIFKRTRYKTIGRLGHTHGKKRWQTFLNQAKQNETRKVDTYYEKKV